MCNFRDHNDVEIYRINLGWNEEAVVRWCKDCGGVAVDRESDGRIWPGYIRKMVFPKLCYEANRRQQEASKKRKKGK